MNRKAVLEQAMRLGLKGVSSNDAGVYTCHSCGESWQSGERYLWWPISFRMSIEPLRRGHGWFTMHGVQAGCDRIEQRVFRRIVRVGPLLVLFGAERD